jgi:hypothetical protein
MHSSNFKPPPIHKPTFDSRGYGWQHEELIDQVCKGTLRLTASPMDTVIALGLVQERFGCVYAALCPELQKDPTIAFIAAVQSGGHTLKNAPEDVRGSFGLDFYSALVDAGVQPWILQYSPLFEVDEATRAQHAASAAMRARYEAWIAQLNTRSDQNRPPPQATTAIPV